MLPFMGYNMSDYFQHWLDLGRKLEASGAKLPKVYCVNWFRKGPDGKFVWPGYGENMRVLQWMVERIGGTAPGRDNAFGITPQYQDLNRSAPRHLTQVRANHAGCAHGAAFALQPPFSSSWRAAAPYRSAAKPGSVLA